MKYETHEDVLALEALYQGLLEKFESVRSKIHDGVYHHIDSDLGAVIPRRIYALKRLELGDRRPEINILLGWLVRNESRLHRYE